MTHCPVCNGSFAGKWRDYKTWENTALGCPGWRLHGQDENGSIPEMKRAWAQIRLGTEKPRYPPEYQLQTQFVRPVRASFAMFTTPPKQHGAPWRTRKAEPLSRIHNPLREVRANKISESSEESSYEENRTGYAPPRKARRNNAKAAFPKAAPSKCPELALSKCPHRDTGSVPHDMISPTEFLRQVMPGPLIFMAYTKEQVLQLLYHYGKSVMDQDELAHSASLQTNTSRPSNEYDQRLMDQTKFAHSARP